MNNATTIDPLALMGITSADLAEHAAGAADRKEARRVAKLARKHAARRAAMAVTPEQAHAALLAECAATLAECRTSRIAATERYGFR